jgi:hypothetical protein
MIDEKMIRIFIEGLAGNVLLFIANISAVELNNYVNIFCHLSVTAGTLFLMYKQYKKHTKQ